MRNPNGYGSVIKLSGKRRKPFAARITVGFDDNGKQKYKYLDTFSSQKEANQALVDYNKNPYDIDKSKATYKQIYNMFYDEKFKHTTKDEKKASKNAYKQGFKKTEGLHDEIFKDLRKGHLQKALDDCTDGDSTKMNILKLYSQMYKFARENDVCEKNYAQFVKLHKEGRKTDRDIFSDKEIAELWDNVNNYDYVDTALIMIYTGLRPGELVDLETEKIYLEERYLVAGFKTFAGTDRIIPIHKKIEPLILKRLEMDTGKYLFLNERKQKLSYYSYYHQRWKPLMDKLKMEHRPHDGRHTFATMMDNIDDINRTSVKKILGHALEGITEKVYTHKNIEQLIRAIDKLD